MTIPSLDAVNKGDWLICIRGPDTKVIDSMGDVKTYTNHNFEGGLMRVVALSPPFLLGEIYTLGSQKTRPYTIKFGFDGTQWAPASRKYVRAYLKRSGVTLRRKHGKTLASGDGLSTIRRTGM